MFATDQAKLIMNKEFGRQPKAVDYRGKLRCLLGEKTAANGTEAGTDSDRRLLIGWLPAGRGRVLFELSAYKSSVTGPATLLVGPYHEALPEEGGGTLGLGILTAETPISTLTLAAESAPMEPVDTAWSVIGWRYESLDDIPVYIDGVTWTDASTAAVNLAYVQE